jgi:hypothetical protein
MVVSLNSRLESNEEEEERLSRTGSRAVSPRYPHARVLEGVDRFKTVFKHGLLF